MFVEIKTEKFHMTINDDGKIREQQIKPDEPKKFKLDNFREHERTCHECRGLFTTKGPGSFKYCPDCKLRKQSKYKYQLKKHGKLNQPVDLINDDDDLGIEDRDNAVDPL